MGRKKGTFEFSSNIEVLKKSPLDARMMVDSYSDLINPSTWIDRNDNLWLFNGLIVGIGNDADPSNNGVYLLLDASNYTNLGSWYQAAAIDSTPSHGENIGNGDASIFKGKVGATLQFRELKGLSDISIYTSGDTIMIGTDIDLSTLEYQIQLNTTKNNNQDVSISYNSILNINQDVSIIDLRTDISTLDASIIRIDNYQLIQDVSISSLKSKTDQLDISLGYAQTLNTIQDVSISSLKSKTDQLDISLGYAQTLNNIQDASIIRIDSSVLYNFNLNINQDASIIDLRNDISTLDASIIRIDNYQLIQDNSIIDLFSRISDVSVRNVGNGEQIFRDISEGYINLRTIESSSYINISTIGNELFISLDPSALSESNYGINIGGSPDVSLYYGKSGQGLQFRSLKSSKTIKIRYLDASIITIDSSGLVTDSSLTSYGFITDTSLQLYDFIKNSSLGPQFIWVGGDLYVDASSSDASINQLWELIDGAYDSSIFVDSSNSITGNISTLDYVVGLLAPAKPSKLGELNLTNPGYYSARIETLGTLVNNITDDQTPTALVSNFLKEENVSLAAFVDGSIDGSIYVTSANMTDISNGSLTIIADVDTYEGQLNKEGFWRDLSANITVDVSIVPSINQHSFNLQYPDATNETGSVLFYIDEPQTPSISDASVNTYPLSITRYISGVPSYLANDNIQISYTVDGAIGKFYNATTLASAVLNAGDTSLSGLPVSPPNEGASVSFSNHILTFDTSKYFESIDVSIIPYNSKEAYVLGSYDLDVSGRIDTISDESDRLLSGAGVYPTTGYGDVYESSISLKTGVYINELQKINGLYRFPFGDYSNWENGPDYSSGVDTSTRWVTFDASVDNISSFTIIFIEPSNFTANIQNVTENIKIYARIDGDISTNGWINCNLPYSGVGNPTNDGDAAMLTGYSTSISKACTFGTVDKTGTMYIRIGIDPSYMNIAFRTITIDTSIVVPDEDVSTGDVSTNAQAWNGLTKTDASIGLGGTLNNNTIINLNNKSFALENNFANVFSIDSSQNISLGNGVQVIQTDASNISLYHNLNKKVISTEYGLEYVNNYTLSFTDRSLIDKGYFKSTLDSSFNDFYSSLNNIESSLNLYVLKSGDTLSGLLSLSSFSLDSITLNSIDTSLEGFGVGLDTALPTSALVKRYVDSHVSSGTEAWNGLTKTDPSIGLGGTIVNDTIIDVSSHILQISTMDGSSDSSISINSLNGISLNATRDGSTGGSIISLKKNLLNIQFQHANGNINNDQKFSFQETGLTIETSGGLIFYDRSDNKNLIKYDQDYSSSMTNDRMLPDIGWINSKIDSSLLEFLPLSGGTMSGNIILDSSSIFNGVVIFNNNTYFDGSVYFTSVESIDVSSAYIFLNTGLSGTPPANLQSGIVIGRGDEEPYAILYDETTQSFRIGITVLDGGSYDDTSMYIIATRDDAPSDKGIFYWNDTIKKIQNNTDLLYNGGLIVNTDVSINSHLSITDGMIIEGISGDTQSYALMSTAATGGIISTRQLTSPAFTSPSNLTVQSPLSINGGSNAVLSAVDISILQASASQNGFISSTDWSNFNQKINEVNNIDVSADASIYSYELNGISYLRKLTAGYGININHDVSVIFVSVANLQESLLIACGDEITNLSVSGSTPAVTFRMPYNFTLTGLKADVNTAPVGSSINVDIHKDGSTLLSTLLSIDDGEKTSVTAAFPPVISDSSLNNNDEITIFITQIGITTPGKGLKVTMSGIKI